ncbi:hypothetical protein K438DRAFT_2017676 [Mycena galopus ATCC 62051]|nr:hypothetical protein K438DRAFT_2024162 [Mycena galopus ATCC 62051]KAF8193542.1 hypothetical protein K438DRAFT_2017676 [Mycena galopus ATCC 62051]
MASSPTLPPELEREIFELCALDLPVFIPVLMLVAKRVSEWVEPLLYRTIILSHDNPIHGYPPFTDDVVLSVSRRKPPAFFHNAVRHLMVLGPHTSAAEAILTLCTAVENLCVSSVPDGCLSLLDRESPSLRRLYAVLDPMPPPTHHMFSRLRHLHLDHDSLDMDSTCPVLAVLPKLTHLSFADVDDFVLASRRILDSCQFICVLIFFDDDATEQKAQLTMDVRCVVMAIPDDFVEDWYQGARHGVDYWTVAETFISKRQTGEINPLHYICHGDRLQSASH